MDVPAQLLLRSCNLLPRDVVIEKIIPNFSTLFINELKNNTINALTLFETNTIFGTDDTNPPLNPEIQMVIHSYTTKLQLTTPEPKLLLMYDSYFKLTNDFQNIKHLVLHNVEWSKIDVQYTMKGLQLFGKHCSLLSNISITCDSFNTNFNIQLNDDILYNLFVDVSNMPCIPRLHRLDVSGNQALSPSSWLTFAIIGSNLQSLTLNQCDNIWQNWFQMSDSNLITFTEVLCRMKKLTHLSLSNCPSMNDWNFRLLGEAFEQKLSIEPIWPKLVSLNISKCGNITTDVLPYIAKWSRLQHLNLLNCPKIYMDDLLHFMSHKLIELKIGTSSLVNEKKIRENEIKFEEEEMEYQRQWIDTLIELLNSQKESLQILCLNNFSFDTKNDLLSNAIVQCTLLTHIDLSMCQQVESNTVIAISKLPLLTHLYLNGCKSLSSSSLYVLSRCKRLHTLELEGCSQIDDTVLTLILDGTLINTLESLNIATCYLISDECVQNAIVKCKSLKRVNVIGCTKITLFSILNLWLSLSMLTHFYFGCVDTSLDTKQLLYKLKKLSLKRAIQECKITNVRSDLAIDIVSQLIKSIDLTTLNNLQFDQTDMKTQKKIYEMVS